jgi:S1-C subfamily serine protease
VLRKLLATVLAASAVSGAAQAATKPPTKTLPKPTTGIVLVNTNLALQGAIAAGTGIVLTKTGEVLTNNHVIAGATTITVTVPATKKTYSASVLGYDVTDDVALIKLQGATNLATATLGKSAPLKTGQATRAVGNAEGGGKLVQTTGKVLALNQTIQIQDDFGDLRTLTSLIETSAHLVPGDSGGPLLNASNQVVGMDAAGSSDAAVNTSGPGYAISIDKVRTIGQQIEAQTSSAVVHIGETAFIGVDVADTQTGVVVSDIVTGTPAEQAGLQQGDVITSLDGTPISTTHDLRTALFAHHPGDTVTLGYTDTNGAAQTASITLASGPPQ